MRLEQLKRIDSGHYRVNHQRHVGKVWESLVDSNVLEPGVYGWQEVTE